MNLLNSFVAQEGRRRQRIGALQIRGVIREMEGRNPLRPQRPGEDLRSILHRSRQLQASIKALLMNPTRVSLPNRNLNPTLGLGGPRPSRLQCRKVHDLAIVDGQRPRWGTS